MRIERVHVLGAANEAHRHPVQIVFDRPGGELTIAIRGHIDVQVRVRQIDALVLLRDVELDDRADALFKELSGGQKQRFSVVSTLVNDPILLFLDEPTTGLDPQARRHMWELVQRFKSEGRTVLLTTHYMEEAEELCDRVAIMDHGKIVAMDRPAALVDSLLSRGFQKDHTENLANLEDVFLDLTGRALRDE